ncbi:MAG: hypothetical protein HQK77_16765 [Desulfobacterales bacterium]|nr:hypothetical protein [Desulfobacterales bacterium]
MSNFTLLLFFLFLIPCVLGLGGCFSKQVTLDTGERLTWKEMNMDQRKAHMRNEVLPRAETVFRSWRPERFKQIDCTLCHGSGVKSDDFNMPTDYLPRLSGKLLLGPEFANHPETTRLKLNKLVPEMADALGLKPFSVIFRTGFGCYSCHLGPTGPKFGN